MTQTQFDIACSHRDIYISDFRHRMQATPGYTMVHLQVGDWYSYMFDAVTDDYGKLVPVGQWDTVRAMLRTRMDE
jgi:hypothetical protein